MKKAKEVIIVDDEPLEGQTSFPGFDVQEQAQDAEAIDKAARNISFQMDFIRDPEDALAFWGAPSEVFSGYLSNQFDRLVKKVAKMTGGDPEQIRDKDRRTPEQDKLLSEMAGREQIARIDKFNKSLYADALAIVFDNPILEPGVIHQEGFEVDVIASQAVIYFFATHSNIKPLDAGELPQEQRGELLEVYAKLDRFYKQKALEVGEDNIKYGETLSEFIRKEIPVKSTAQSVLKKIPLLQSINPKAHTMPNNPLMNALQQKSIIEHPEEAQGWDLPVANAKGKRKEITSFVMATYDPGETGITMTGANLTEYERQVSDAVVSLFIETKQAGLPPVFTPDMIFRAMPGGSNKASAQQKGAITRTIEKFRRLHIVIDATEEMRKRGLIGETATYKLDAFYLNITHAEYRVKNGGQSVNAYKVESEPIILTYAKMTNQLLTVPAKYLAIEKVKKDPRTGALAASGELIAMSPERQAMTGYLLRRIAVMKRDTEKAKESLRSYNRRRQKDKTLEEKTLEDFKEKSDIILFETVFNDAGLKISSRDTIYDNRNFCFDVLNYQIVDGNIKGYEKQSKGRSITGVKILL